MEPSWMVPQLSLMSEAHKELDRRRAARLPLIDLQIVADRLICDWYRYEQLFNCAMRRVAALEVELALSKVPDRQGRNEPTGEHYQWAREVQAQIASASCSTSSDMA
jgi:hypothetical protein